MKEVEDWSNKYERLELLVGEKDQASAKMLGKFIFYNYFKKYLKKITNYYLKLIDLIE